MAAQDAKEMPDLVTKYGLDLSSRIVLPLVKQNAASIEVIVATIEELSGVNVRRSSPKRSFLNFTCKDHDRYLSIALAENRRSNLRHQVQRGLSQRRWLPSSMSTKRPDSQKKPNYPCKLLRVKRRQRTYQHSINYSCLFCV